MGGFGSQIMLKNRETVAYFQCTDKRDMNAKSKAFGTSSEFILLLTIALTTSPNQTVSR